MTVNPKPRRSLILAGGGLKVAFQAGVLQTWLDEAGLTFDHVDGASGGVLNLAMYSQGLSGTRIADNWRQLDPRTLFDVNWSELARPLQARSIATLDGLRDKVLPRWGIDWSAIRASARAATFNVYNFSKHELRVLEAREMTEDLLLAAVSLPVWFPPVRVLGDLHVDAVFATDGNLEEAIRRGADEIWVVWTVSQRDEWNDGLVAQYFQMIECAANSQFKRVVERIEASNAALAAGRHAEFDRPLKLRVLRAEVPLHYLLDLTRDRLAEVVNLGVREARRFCDEEEIPWRPAVTEAPSAALDAPDVSFRERMRGFVTLGERVPEVGFKHGKAARTALTLTLAIDVADIDRFVQQPDHAARATGTLTCEALGGELTIDDGVFNLLVDEADPAHKRMIYRLFFHDGAGRPRTIYGVKEVADDPGFDLWPDTTTLYTRVLAGRVPVGGEESAEVTAAGIVHVHMLDFFQQLTTFRARGEGLHERALAFARFGRLFFGKLWDVYGRRVLPYGPI